jgi:hypothetical protein
VFILLCLVSSSNVILCSISVSSFILIFDSKLDYVCVRFFDFVYGFMQFQFIRTICWIMYVFDCLILSVFDSSISFLILQFCLCVWFFDSACGFRRCYSAVLARDWSYEDWSLWVYAILYVPLWMLFWVCVKWLMMVLLFLWIIRLCLGMVFWFSCLCMGLW